MLLSDYCQPAFLETMMRRCHPAPGLRVLRVSPLPVDTSASILAALTAGQSAAPVGHVGLEVTFQLAGEAPQTQRMVLKVKPPGAEVSAMLGGLAQACGGELAATYPAFELRTGFADTHRRELDLYALRHPLMPRVYGLHCHEARNEHAVLLEYLHDDVELLNSVMQPAAWTDAHLRAALDQLAAWHAAHLRPDGATAPAWPNRPSAAYMADLQPLWQALLDHATQHFPALCAREAAHTLATAVECIPDYWAALAAEPHTLVHNDLNPRNTCFRRGPAGELLFVAYDWELATYHVPHYDVVELLCFVLDADRYAQRLDYLEYYRQRLHARTGCHASAAHFRRIAALAALDFGLHRLGLYLMAHTVSPYSFLPRVVRSYSDTLAQLRPLAHLGVEAPAQRAAA